MKIMTIKHMRAAACLFTASLTTLGLTGCGQSGGSGSSPSPSADAHGETVATTKVWADVAASVLGHDVGAIISNPSTDPHEYEPTAADHARANSAELVVANGGVYDAALYSTTDPVKVISALPLTEAHNHEHGHDHGEGHEHGHGDNEHVWYSTTALADVGHKVADTAGGSTDALNTRLSEIASALAALPDARVAQVHPIADAIVEESPLEDVTPDAYRAASLDETEPSGAAVAEFIDELRAGHVDALISDPQSPNGSAQRIVDEAKAAGVPVVEVYETPPGGENFLDYFLRVARELARSLQ